MLPISSNPVLSSFKWTPRSLGEVLLEWHDGSLNPGVDGTAIDRWYDRGFRVKDATQAGGARPVLVTNVAATLDGKNVIAFNGNSAYFFVEDIFAAATAGSVYVLIKSVEDPNTVATQSGLWNMSNSILLPDTSHYCYTDGNIYEAFGTTVRKSPIDPTPSLAAWRIYHVYSAANDWAMYLDGVLTQSSGTNTVGFPTQPIIGQGIATTIFFYGYIAEIFFTKEKQSDSDRQKAEGYLAHKYGLQANLADSHPYRTSRP